MCGKTPKAPPPPVQRDPVAEQRIAEAKAQREANSATAAKRKRRAASGDGGMAGSAMRAATLGGAGVGPSLLAKAKPEP